MNPVAHRLTGHQWPALVACYWDMGVLAPGKGLMQIHRAVETVPGNGSWVLPLTVLTATVALMFAAPSGAVGPCDPPVTNPIVCENSKPGNPQSEWDVSGAGDASIQGFATDISVNQGQTVRFKVDTDATTTGSTSTGWATTAATAPARSRPSSRRRPAADTSRPA